MAIIDNDIVVKYGEDGELRFEHPGKRAFLVLQNLGKDENGEPLPEDGSWKQLWAMLKSVKNLQKADGTEVTVESLRALDHSPIFFAEVIREYSKVIEVLFNGQSKGSDEKKG